MRTSFLFWAVVFCGGGMPVMLALSQPFEIRRGRWWRIGLSLPVLLFAAHQLVFKPASQGQAIGNVQAYVICVASLAGIWGPNIAWLGAQFFNRLLFGSGKGGGGFRPDFRGARMLIKDDDLEGAIRALERELAKDPANYEGRMLLAAIYKELRQPEKGLEQVSLILVNAEAMPEQVAAARAAEHELRVLQLQLDAEKERRQR